MKIAKKYAPAAVDIPHFDQFRLKFEFSGSYTLIVAPMGVKFGKEEALLHTKFDPHRGEKPQYRPVSNLNNWRFALRAMLPVKN